ncbi:hypothetical protein XENOCAPTIV_002911, partial [Xenoophorus captivus]
YENPSPTCSQDWDGELYENGSFYIGTRDLILKENSTQVVLLTSREDPVTQALVDKLKKMMGCEVMEVGQDPLKEVQSVVEQ